ncbi:MAG: di-heme oxidoredictase family protein, partial [Gammaproteobacteria bacterium]
LTVERSDKEAYKQMAPNAGGQRFPQFMFGQRQFTTEWDPAPGQVPDTDGLGPTFNAVACASCHINNGRGRPPESGEAFESILVRLSVPGTDEHGGPATLPAYGGQLQHRAVEGADAEGTAVIEWKTVTGSFADGTPYQLRKPIVSFTDLAYGEMPKNLRYSLRVANPVIGMGLLESVPDSTLLAIADPPDADGNNVSGRVNMVWNPETQTRVPGRFGWKANVVSLELQTAGAALGDMGITTLLNPADNCPAAQESCLQVARLHPEKPEFRPEFFDQLVRYLQLLAVPAQRNAENVQVGQALFAASACVNCHLPTLVTGPNDKFPELAEQTIHPYSDLLLHDMGSGLADNRSDYLANGREWRTPPLWGIGLSETITGHSTYLHDGRARSLSEAIIWHGGEAAAAREAFLKMRSADRLELLAFLASL